MLGPPQHSSGTEYLYHCPEHSEGKKKLSVNFDKNVAKCWVCGLSFGSLRLLVRRFGKHHHVQQWRELNRYHDFSLPDSLQDRIKPKIDLPKEYKCLANCKKPLDCGLPLRYLQKREVSKSLILKYKIGYCSSGKYKDRIVIPSFDLMGKVDYFVARNYVSDYLRYSNPPTHRDLIFNELWIDWEKPIVLTEGVFDAIKVSNSIPILGTEVSEDSLLFRKIVEFSDTVVLALDNTARFKQNKISKLLLSYDLDVNEINLKGNKDLGELTMTEAECLVTESTQVSMLSDIKHKLARL